MYIYIYVYIYIKLGKLLNNICVCVLLKQKYLKHISE